MEELNGMEWTNDNKWKETEKRHSRKVQTSRLYKMTAVLVNGIRRKLFYNVLFAHATNQFLSAQLQCYRFAANSVRREHCYEERYSTG